MRRLLAILLLSASPLWAANWWFKSDRGAVLHVYCAGGAISTGPTYVQIVASVGTPAVKVDAAGNAPSLRFGDTNSYITIARKAELNFGTATPYTLSFWVKHQTPGTGAAQRYLCSGNIASDPFIGTQYATASTQLQITTAPVGAATSCTGLVTTNIVDNLWHHLVMIDHRDTLCLASNYEIWIDGVSQTLSLGTATSLPGISLNAADVWAFGARKNTTYAQFFYGNADEMMIEPWIVPGSEIIRRYQAGAQTHSPHGGFAK